MKANKKILTVALALVLCIGALTACGSKEDPTNTTQAPSNKPATTTKPASTTKPATTTKPEADKNETKPTEDKNETPEGSTGNNDNASDTQPEGSTGTGN